MPNTNTNGPDDPNGPATEPSAGEPAQVEPAQAEPAQPEPVPTASPPTEPTNDPDDGARQDPRGSVLPNNSTVTQEPARKVFSGGFAGAHEDHKRDSDEISIDELAPATLNRLDRVFVPPPTFDSLIARCNTQQDSVPRIFLVEGLPRSGRFSCAVRLGRALPGGVKRQYFICRPRTRQQLLLVDVIPRPIVEHGIYVIEDILRLGIILAGSDPYLEIVNKDLRKQQAYLILTAEPSTDSDHRIQTIPTDGTDLPKAFEQHLEWYGTGNDRLYIDKWVGDALNQESRREIVKSLKTPVQVNQLCVLVGKQQLGEGSDPAETIKRIREIADSLGQSDVIGAHRRFEGFSLNGKLVALLVGLFPGARRTTLEGLYTGTVAWLRADGLPYKDARLRGLDDLYLDLGIQEGDSGRLEYIDKLLEQEVIKNQIPNYRHLLWSVVEHQSTWVQGFIGPGQWEFRATLGAAIGRLGQYRPQQLKSVLDDLARQSEAEIAALPGYALQQLCKDDSSKRGFVIEILTAWSKSQDADLMWAAGAAVWRVYPHFASLDSTDMKSADDLDEILGELAAGLLRLDDPEQTTMVFFSLLRAIREILRDCPQAMTSLLGTWLRRELHPDSGEGSEELQTIPPEPADDQARRNVAGHIAQGLFAFDRKTDRLIEVRHGRLLDLVTPILNAGKETVVEVMDSLLEWCSQEGWCGRVEVALLHAANRGNHEQRELLCAPLAYQWTKSEIAGVRAAAERVLARALLLNGFPCDLPSAGRALVIADGGRLARREATSARVAYQLYERLRARVGLMAGVLGGNRPVRTEQAITQASFQSDHPHSCLLLPLLDQLSPQETPFVLLLAWDEVIDLEDVLELPWKDRIILIPFSGVQFPEHPLFHHVFQLTTDAAIGPADILVGRTLGYRLVRRSSQDWEHLLEQTFRDIQPLDEPSLYAEIDRMATNLDRLDSIAAPTDHARLISCALLWLAGRNMARAVDLLDRWAHAEAPVDTLAESCAILLLRTYAEWNLQLGDEASHDRPPQPDIDALAPLLRLGPLLARRESRVGIEALLRLVRHWSIDSRTVGEQRETWSERFRQTQPNGKNELLTTLKQLPADWNSWLRDRLSAEQPGDAYGETWQRPMPEFGEKEVISSGVRQVRDWLLLRLGLRGARATTDLPKDGWCGVILVDPGNDISRQSQFLPDLAVELFKQFEAKAKDALHLLMYRIGESRPVVVTGEKPTFDLLRPEFLPARHRLIAPLLEQLPLERVRWCVLLTADPPYDLNDMDDFLPRSRSFVYHRPRRSGADTWGSPHWQSPYLPDRNAKAVSEASSLCQSIHRLLSEEATNNERH